MKVIFCVAAVKSHDSGLQLISGDALTLKGDDSHARFRDMRQKQQFVTLDFRVSHAVSSEVDQ